MTAKPRLDSLTGTSTIAAATVAAFVAFGTVTLVVDAFTSRGTPWQARANAARACEHHRYLSEREACMQEWLAARQGRRIADEGAPPVR